MTAPARIACVFPRRTAAEMREALPCMEPDVRAAAEGAIAKLECMSAGEYDALVSWEAAP